MTTVEDRFWVKVTKSDGCWQWTGAINGHGYGHLKVGGAMIPAHRLSYTWSNGPIATGLEIDHLCRNRSCVRPDHLEAVSHQENGLRGESAFAVNARREVCKNGHPFDAANTYMRDGILRSCRACNRAAVARHRARKSAARQDV